MASPSPASLRWRLLRHYLLSDQGCAINQELTEISRRPNGHFGLITFRIISYCERTNDEKRLPEKAEETQNVLIEYDLLARSNVKFVLLQRKVDGVSQIDLARSPQHQIDNTGIVGLWPAEEVLTHFCISKCSMFRNKRVVEVGSGYGLAGLVIAACTDAAEVVLTDGNPQVIDYLEYNIMANLEGFGKTKVRSSILRWDKELSSSLRHSFDIVIAADCTFFKASHTDLANSVKGLLKRSRDCKAFLFNPKRNGSLNSFVQVAKELRLSVELVEKYDDHVWVLHQSLLTEHSSSWPNYSPDHCYPVLAVLTHTDLENPMQSGNLSM